MYNYMVQNPQYLTHDNNEGLERAINENYAYLMESSSIQYIIERNCDVTQIGDLLDDKNYGIGMRKGKAYAPIDYKRSYRHRYHIFALC